MAVYSVTSTRDTLQDVVSFLKTHSGDNPLALGQAQCFLPTRRSCRRAARLFLEGSGSTSLILPKLTSLGDLQTSGCGLPSHQMFEDEEGLFHLVSFLIQEKIVDSASQALHWGKSLLSLLEECVLYEVPLGEALARLLEDEHALHRQGALASLQTFLQAWGPQNRPLLKREDHARALLDLQRDWQSRPPQAPILALGIHMPAPLYGRFLATLAGLSQGLVLLSDLDQSLSEAQWRALTPAHPQWAHKGLLDRLGVHRQEVAPWPFSQEVCASALSRHRLLCQSFHDTLHGGGPQLCHSSAPSSHSHASLCHSRAGGNPPTPQEWTPAFAGVTKDAGVATATEVTTDAEVTTNTGLTLIECENRQEEAWAIALHVREALDDPHQRVLCVTPDRSLARLVGEILKKWQILPDDGGGIPALQISAFIFCHRVLTAVSQDFESISLLSLLKHPLFVCARPPGRVRALARVLELEGLRTPFYGQNLGDLQACIKDNQEAWQLLEDLKNHTHKLRVLLSAPQTSFLEILREHIRVATLLASKDSIWEGQHRAELEELWQTLLKAAAFFPPLAGREYPRLFQMLLSTYTLRPQHGVHPRVSILSPQQAALAKADLVLLSGLNEGLWPLSAAPDPWLSPSMRGRLGLPSFASTLGESSRAFLELASSPQVVMTRTKRVEGAPQTPARALLRLQARLKACGLEKCLDNTSPWRTWAQALTPTSRLASLAPPAPRPSFKERPSRVSLSSLSLLQKDPYLFYARTILGLNPLLPIAPPPDGRLFGILIHTCLERFWEGADLSLDRLLALGREVFAPLEAFAWVRLFWWQRFEKLAPWIISQAQAPPPQVRSYLEQKACLQMPLPQGRTLEIVAKADRLDYDPIAQEVTVIDYKTGALPTRKEISEGLALQLPLECVMLARGGFEKLPQDVHRKAVYWHLKAPFQVVALENVPALETTALETLGALIKTYWEDLAPFQPCATPGTLSTLTPEQHLTRIHEWSRPSL